MNSNKQRAPRNRTLTCNQEEINRLSANIVHIDNPVSIGDISGKIISGDLFDIAGNLPKCFVDLLILDPLYNLSKNYNDHLFKEKEKDEYRHYLEKSLIKSRHTSPVPWQAAAGPCWKLFLQSIECCRFLGAG